MDDEDKVLPWWKRWTDERAAWWSKLLLWVVCAVGGALVLYAIYRCVMAIFGIYERAAGGVM